MFCVLVLSTVVDLETVTQTITQTVTQFFYSSKISKPVQTKLGNYFRIFYLQNSCVAKQCKLKIVLFYRVGNYVLW